MKLSDARYLRTLLDRAIYAAESSGKDEVVLADTAAGLDDAARAELDAALKAAKNPAR